MKFTINIILLLFSVSLLGQHTSLKCEGHIPDDFITSSYEKYKADVKGGMRNAKWGQRRSQKDFFLESNYVIDRLLQSGYILFNDPVSKYIREVAHKLLKDEPLLKKQLRFYAVKSSAVNAFAINQGIIFVNIGLIARLENEAQLAFVLAHEIAHYTERHALEFYLEARQIENASNKEVLGQQKFEAAILDKNKFSREQEIEADSVGMLRFLGSEYDLESVKGIFTILDEAHLAFQEKFFHKSFFEDDYLIFPERFSYKSEKDSKVASKEVKSMGAEGTHPSIPKRRLNANRQKKGIDNSGRKPFLLDEAWFQDVREKARLELVEYNLRDYDYYRAIYNAYVFLKENPAEKYFQKTIVKALYGLTKYRNAEDFDEVEQETHAVEGKMKGLAHFINELKKEELNALAIRYAYLLRNDFSGDEVFQDIIEDLCFEMVKHHAAPLKSFKAEVPNFKYSDLDSLDQLLELGWDSTKVAEMKQLKEEENYFLWFVFGDFFSEPSFRALLEDSRTQIRAMKKVAQNKKRPSYWESSFSSKRKSSKGDYSLGKQKVMLVNPFYLKFNKEFEKELPIKTEKSQERFHELILKNSEIADLELVILDGANMKSGDTEQFNDLYEIREWYGHHLGLDDDMKMIAYNQEKVNAITKKYGVDAILWMGVITGQVKKDIELLALLLYNQPGFIYRIITKNGESVFFTIVLDIDSGDINMEVFDMVWTVDNNDFLNQRIYDVLWQVRRDPK